MPGQRRRVQVGVLLPRHFASSTAGGQRLQEKGQKGLGKEGKDNYRVTICRHSLQIWYRHLHSHSYHFTHTFTHAHLTTGELPLTVETRKHNRLVSTIQWTSVAYLHTQAHSHVATRVL